MTEQHPPAPPQAYDDNAQHGQNRAGVEIGEDESFEEYVATPIDLHRADEIVAEEDPVLLERMHERGHDVLDPDAPTPEGEPSA